MYYAQARWSRISYSRLCITEPTVNWVLRFIGSNFHRNYWTELQFVLEKCLVNWVKLLGSNYLEPK